MDIQFSSRTLQRSSNSKSGLSRKWGKQRGRTIARRLQQLLAAATLKDAFTLPAAKLHALKGSRSGQFAVDVDYPYRLVFVPNHNPLPLRDGALDVERVTKIKVIEVVNYHGK